ncbi:MAG: fused MFS/spermidine synthase, partial [Desulfobacterales bacterium]|nr:fused MFS/spermidine synthase [Desulfobacterales bacterium]
MSEELSRTKKNGLFNNPLFKIILAVLTIPVSVIFITKTLPESDTHGNVIYEKESRYNYIRVVDDDPVRSLLFTKGPGAKIQSAIYPDSPDKLVLEYSQMVFAGIAFVRQPQRILIVGLGGGIIPSVFAKYFPDLQIDVVELDGEIVHVAKKFFNYNPSARTNIIVADGRVYVRRAKHEGIQYDLIVLDAFNGSYIPSHLTTRDFLQEVFLLLKDGGCVVSNIHHRNRL